MKRKKHYFYFLFFNNIKIGGIMKFFWFVLFFFGFFTCNSFKAQNFPWTNKCEQAQSEAEMGSCLSSSCKEANVYFDQVYNTLFKNVQTELKKSKKGTAQFDILSKYVTFLPRLKKSLAENALCISELESASNIDGSGYAIFKHESLLKQIENNISLLKNLEAEIPSFN